MGYAFRLRHIRETASRFRTIFRVALSATHPIRKMRPTIRPKTGSRFPKHSMQRWHKECPQLPAWSFKNVLNDYKRRTMATTQVEDGQRATSRTNKLA